MSVAIAVMRYPTTLQGGGLKTGQFTGGEEYEEVPDEEVVILKMAGKIVDTPKDPP